MSRIVRFHRTGGPEVLQFDELHIGPPKAGEV
jgi:NADPH:quinone reductase